MSGSGDFTENMRALRIMPVAISYEIEPCGIRKAYEVYVKRMMGSYVKRPGEDLESVVSGILQQKGRVHVAFCKPISEDELKKCAGEGKNECFRALAQLIDDRILAAWKIWPFNIAAAEMLEGRPVSDRQVTADFERYLTEELRTLPLSGNRRPIRDILISIYATPALRKGF